MTALGFALLFAIATIPGDGEGKHLHAYVYEEDMSWWEAYEFCRRKGKDLVTIMNNQDHWHLQQATLRCGNTCLNGQHLTHIWTAGSDLGQTNPSLPPQERFQWFTTGQPIARDRWDAQHPPDNFQNEEHCVELWDRPEEIKTVLNDVSCGKHWEKYYVVCESKDAFGT